MGREGLTCCCCCRWPGFLAGRIGPETEKRMLKMLKAAWWGGDGVTEKMAQATQMYGKSNTLLSYSSVNVLGGDFCHITSAYLTF